VNLEGKRGEVGVVQIKEKIVYVILLQ